MNIRHSILLLSVIATGCSTHVEQVSDKEINAKADSIVKTRVIEMNKAAMEDLEKRMTIEVKAKADSIVAARTNKNLPAKDTAAAALIRRDSMSRRHSFEERIRRHDTTNR